MLDINDYKQRVKIGPEEYERTVRVLANSLPRDASPAHAAAAQAIIDQPDGFFAEKQREFLHEHAQDVLTIAKELLPQVRHAFPIAYGDKEFLDLMKAIYEVGYITKRER